MRVRLAACLAALLGLCVAGARAGEQSVDVRGVRVTVGTHWPATLNRGWQPATVHLANETSEDRTVDLRFQGNAMATEDVLTRTVRLRAGATERFEVALPARPSTSNAYMLWIRAGENGYLRNVGAEVASASTERVVLVASRNGPLGADLARWSAAAGAEAEPRVPTGQSLRALGYGGTSVLRAGGAAAVAENVKFGGIAFENLSALPQCYTSLHALVLDVEGGAGPAREVLDAIGTATRAGGVLAVAGRGARAFIAGEPALARWALPRFRVAEDGSVTTYVCGLGLLLVLDGDGLLDSGPAVGALNKALESLAPLDVAARRDFHLPIPGIEVPFRALTLLLIVFAILVGPVNLILVRRSRRPALLLLSIPGLAIAFALGLVVYGIAAQGLDVKATSSSVGVLDVRAHHGSSEERREVFAGLAFGPGLQPGPGTTVLRLDAPSWDFRDRREYRIEQGEAVTLSGSWLPVRTPTKLRVTTDRAVRARIDLERGPDGWKAANGLDTTVSSLVFRDADGELHGFLGSIAPGRSALATPIEPSDPLVADLDGQRILARPVAEGGWLPRGTWIARLSGSPLVDPLGLEYEEVRGAHYLLGVLDLQAGR